MSLTTIRQERLAWLNWKDIAPMRQALASLPSIQNIHYTLGNTVTIDSSQINDAKKEAIKILHTKMVQTQVRIHKQTMALILQMLMETTSTVIHKN